MASPQKPRSSPALYDDNPWLYHISEPEPPSRGGKVSAVRNSGDSNTTYSMFLGQEEDQPGREPRKEMHRKFRKAAIQLIDKPPSVSGVDEIDNTSISSSQSYSNKIRESRIASKPTSRSSLEEIEGLSTISLDDPAPEIPRTDEFTTIELRSSADEFDSGQQTSSRRQITNEQVLRQIARCYHDTHELARQVSKGTAQVRSRFVLSTE